MARYLKEASRFTNREQSIDPETVSLFGGRGPSETLGPRPLRYCYISITQLSEPAVESMTRRGHQILRTYWDTRGRKWWCWTFYGRPWPPRRSATAPSDSRWWWSCSALWRTAWRHRTDGRRTWERAARNRFRFCFSSSNDSLFLGIPYLRLATKRFIQTGVGQTYNRRTCLRWRQYNASRFFFRHHFSIIFTRATH